MPEESQQQYLQVRNWDKYQTRLKNGKPGREWIRVECNLEDDPLYCKLDDLSKLILIGIWRLRGRTGKNPPNDPRHIYRALAITPQNAHNIPTSISRLIHANFLILTNQQNYEEFALQDKTRQDKTLVNHKKHDLPAQHEQKTLVAEPPAFAGQILKLSQKNDSAFKVAFPEINLEAEYQKADAWMVSNPGKRKTDHGRFMNNWLSRAQERQDFKKIRFGGNGNGKSDEEYQREFNEYAERLKAFRTRKSENSTAVRLGRVSSGGVLQANSHLGS